MKSLERKKHKGNTVAAEKSCQRDVSSTFDGLDEARAQDSRCAVRLCRTIRQIPPFQFKRLRLRHLLEGGCTRRPAATLCRRTGEAWHTGADLLQSSGTVRAPSRRARERSVCPNGLLLQAFRFRNIPFGNLCFSVVAEIYFGRRRIEESKLRDQWFVPHA